MCSLNHSLRQSQPISCHGASQSAEHPWLKSTTLANCTV